MNQLDLILTVSTFIYSWKSKDMFLFNNVKLKLT